MRKKKWFLILFIFINIFLFIVFSKNEVIVNTKSQIYRILVGDPIDINTGEINNRYFNIDDTGNRETAKNINAAIEYANKNNIEYIKLKKGTYKVNGIGNYKQKKGIVIKSNLEMDFNGSTIIHEKNNDPTYALICIYGENNIKLSNGILIGDREEHNYAGSTHEWGMGIEIRFGNNIEIRNFEIYDMTGDGIYITGVEDDKGRINTSENIIVENCNIHHCRRQGISIICANVVEIRNNEIHDINGALPSNGIDLESNKNIEKIDKVKIYKNTFYNLGGKAAIEVFRGAYTVEIYENELNGDILCFDAKTEINIHDNIMKNEMFRFYTDDFLQSIGCYNKKAIIERNQIYNGYMDINDVEEVFIENNTLKEGYISINSCNGQICYNTVENQKQRQFAYEYKAERIEKEYKIKVLDNRALGNFEKIENVQESENLTINKK